MTLKTDASEKFIHWQERLKETGLASVVAIAIEAAGPLSVLAAQGLYLVDPILNGFSKRSSLADLAEILEDREQSQHFAAMLRNR